MTDVIKCKKSGFKARPGFSSGKSDPWIGRCFVCEGQQIAGQNVPEDLQRMGLNAPNDSLTISRFEKVCRLCCDGVTLLKNGPFKVANFLH